MKRYIFLCIIALLSIASCVTPYVERDSDRFLMTLVNNTEKGTVWVIPEHGNNGCELSGELPDELKIKENAEVLKVDSRTKLHISVCENGKASVYETYHPEDQLKIYVFDSEVYRNTEWAQLKSDEMWLSKLSISAEDIVKNNYEVVFE